MDCSLPAPLSMGFSRQKYWSGLHFQALNEEQIQMRKAAIQNRVTLDMLTAAQGGTCVIIKVECCVYIPDLSGYISATLDDMKGQVNVISGDNLPFWTLVLSWVKGDWWKTIFTIVIVALWCWKRVFAMTCAFSWQNSISLCPASLHIPRPNFPVTPGVS